MDIRNYCIIVKSTTPIIPSEPVFSTWLVVTFEKKFNMCNPIRSTLKTMRRLSVRLRVRTAEVKLDSQRQNRRKEDRGGWRHVSLVTSTFSSPLSLPRKRRAETSEKVQPPRNMTTMMRWASFFPLESAPLLPVERQNLHYSSVPNMQKGL